MHDLSKLKTVSSKTLATWLIEHHDTLTTYSTAELKACWQKLCPKRAIPAAKALLVPQLLWQAQAKLYGGLSAEVKTALKPYQQQFIESLKHPTTSDRSGNADRQSHSNTAAKPAVNANSKTSLKAKQLPVGSVLTRHWHGRDYQVTVVGKNRFEFAGESYRSLSKIAEVITGTHWSGPRFFGLQKLVA